MSAGPKLRAVFDEQLTFHVVLVEPEIPPNTGATARTCVAANAHLHLIEPLGFRTDSQAVRRAGLDYWPHLHMQRHRNFDTFREANPDLRLHMFSARASASYLEADFRAGDALVFGKESQGLDAELIDRHAQFLWAIPTLGPVRSLNLSNAAAIVVYEGLRQIGALQQTHMG